ncbi:MAG: hydrogenase maturation protease [Candidatus Anammoximicrobium sp.]|nr:hydrogenase maturation protease [Candidatus Anammoximicrobium sp.]
MLRPCSAWRVLVIGYGNTLRGDDAVGPILAERLRGEVLAEGLLILSCHQLTPELASDVAACEHVVFLDASLEIPVGEIECRPLTPLPRDAAPLVHSLSPERLLALAQLCYGCVPQATLVSVGGLRFDFGDAVLSPPVAATVEPALQRIRELIGLEPRQTAG